MSKRTKPEQEDRGTSDVLAEMMRAGARKLIAQALDAEVAGAVVDVERQMIAGMLEHGGERLQEPARPVRGLERPRLHVVSESRLGVRHDSLRSLVFAVPHNWPEPGVRSP